jgi:branched-chain amino acid transport system substrate-binding protein
MNKKGIIGIIVVLLIILVVVFNGNQNDGPKPVVKIGVTLPLTGPVAMLGESAQKALLLAQNNLKDTKYDYELVFEDDGFKPATGATVVNKLISVDNVSAVFSFGSPVGNVVSPVTEVSKVPHINFFASDTNVANGDYNFLHYTPPYIDTELFVKELQERDLKNIVVFEIADNSGAAAISQALEKSIEGTDIKIVANPKFNSGTRDFRTLINNVKNLDADIYVLQSSSPELETLFNQMRELGVNTPVTSIETFEFADNLALFEGSWYINAADPQKWFVDEFAKEYGSDPKFGSAHAYDSLNILVDVIEKIGNGKTVPTRDEIKEGISSIKTFDGAMGNNLRFDETGQLVSGAVVREVRDGKPVTVKVYNPEN